jgi:hypothetical protein
MNDMAAATVIVNDPNFASTQKYKVTGDSTLVGYGDGTGPGGTAKPSLTIEEPTGTEVFHGYIDKVETNARAGVVLLHCKDLLYQLANARITYDTRADLNGSGLRQSVPYRMSGTNEHGVVSSGANYDLYDTIAGWADGAFFGGGVDQHYLLFSNTMGGKQSIWHGAETAAPSAGGTVNTGDVGSTWRTEPDEVHIAKSDGNGDDWDYGITFKCYVPYGKITQVDVEYSIYATDASAFDALTFDVYNHRTGGTGLAAGWYELRDFDLSTLAEAPGEFTSEKIIAVAKKIGCDNAGDLLNDGGDENFDFRFAVDCDAAARAELCVKYLELTIYVEGVTVNSSSYALTEDGASYIRVGTDLTGQNIDKHCPYMLTKVITKYVADVVTTYDTNITLDAATDVTASTNLCARHFHYQTPLEILQHLVRADGTEFWVDDGDDIHWNDPFTVPGGTTLQDSDVLYWITPTLSLDALGNDVVVLGQRFEDVQITGTAEDTTSRARYGTFTLVEENPSIATKKDADDLATTLKTRYKEPVYSFGYAVNGFSTLDVGYVHKITSTDLALTDAYYVVTEKRYDSRKGVTEFGLTLRSTDGLFQLRKWEDGTRSTLTRLDHAMRYQSYNPLHTETWS